jgi:hypothetical protein
MCGFGWSDLQMLGEGGSLCCDPDFDDHQRQRLEWQAVELAAELAAIVAAAPAVAPIVAPMANHSKLRRNRRHRVPPLAAMTAASRSPEMDASLAASSARFYWAAASWAWQERKSCT